MMKVFESKQLWLVVPWAALAVGCHAGHPGTALTSFPTEGPCVVLANDVAAATTTRPATTTAPAPLSAIKLAFTAPDPVVRQQSLLAGGSGGRLSGGDGVRMNLVELTVRPDRIVSPTGGLVSRPGLGAPSPHTLNAIHSRSGLQRGPAAGLGFAARQTVLGRQPNFVAGPCRSLVRAGFFGNQSACQARFRR